MSVQLSLWTNEQNGRLRSFIIFMINSSWKLHVFTETQQNKKNEKVAKLPHTLYFSFTNPTKIKNKPKEASEIFWEFF